jgi:hypothetical protein
MTVASRRPRPSACPARLRACVLDLLGPRVPDDLEIAVD